MLDFPPPLSLSTLVARCLDLSADPNIEKYRGLGIDPKNYDAWDRAVRFVAEQNPKVLAPLTTNIDRVAEAAFPEHKKPLPGATGGVGDYRKNIVAWMKKPEFETQVNIVRFRLKNAPLKSAGGD